MTRALSIVGMRRSGTSLLCLLLNRLGVSFGPSDNLIQADSFNEEGYWEHKRLTSIHRRFRLSLGLPSVDTDPTPHDWFERPASAHWVQRAVQCIETDFQPLAAPWAWKDPDASMALPFVDRVANLARYEPITAICVRHPGDVVRSESRRTGAAELQSLGAWVSHTLEAMAETPLRSRVVVLFETLVHDPRTALQPLLDALGHKPTAEQWSNALREVRSELIHGDFRTPPLPDLASAVWTIAKTAEGGFTEAVDRDLRLARGSLAVLREMFQPAPPLETATLGASWKVKGRSELVEAAYRPTRSWQSVEVQVSAPASTRVKLFLFPLPAHIWVRSAVWRSGGDSTPAALLPGSSGNLQDRFGLTCISIIHGVDQLEVETPATRGPFSLQIEFLIETSPLIVGDTFRFLSEQCRR